MLNKLLIILFLGAFHQNSSAQETMEQRKCFVSWLATPDTFACNEVSRETLDLLIEGMKPNDFAYMLILKGRKIANAPDEIMRLTKIIVYFFARRGTELTETNYNFCAATFKAFAADEYNGLISFKKDFLVPMIQRAYTKNNSLVIEAFQAYIARYNHRLLYNLAIEARVDSFDQDIFDHTLKPYTFEDKLGTFARTKISRSNVFLNQFCKDLETLTEEELKKIFTVNYAEPDLYVAKWLIQAYELYKERSVEEDLPISIVWQCNALPYSVRKDAFFTNPCNGGLSIQFVFKYKNKMDDTETKKLLEFWSREQNACESLYLSIMEYAHNNEINYIDSKEHKKDKKTSKNVFKLVEKGKKEEAYKILNEAWNKLPLK